MASGNMLFRALMSLGVVWMLYCAIGQTVMNYRNGEYGAACDKLSDAGHYGEAATCDNNIVAWLSTDRPFLLLPMKIQTQGDQP
jgi:hypothetical protein